MPILLKKPDYQKYYLIRITAQEYIVVIYYTHKRLIHAGVSHILAQV